MKIPLTTIALALVATALYADPLKCTLTEYKRLPGLIAAVADDVLEVSWDGDKDQELRLRLGITSGTPTIRDLAVRRKGGRWATLASNLTPEFRVVSGLRRISEQQLSPLRTWGEAITPDRARREKWDTSFLAITPEILERGKWDPFWDDPLYIPGVEEARPPRNPGLPRKPEEIKRATATYRADGCTVRTNGARLEVTFPGVQLGVFAGRLQFTVYKGTNLIRQEVIAKTDEPSVAYKYDTGLAGLAIQPATKIVWRDLANNWQDYQFGGAPNKGPVPLKASNRVVVAELAGGSIAAFPPPHKFFWAREAETNLGYTWYRKDTDAVFSFGVRQAEREDIEVYRGNFALYNAPPGTWQRMAAYFYVGAESAPQTIQSVLAFTHGDRFKPLSGYQVMGNHYHSEYGNRLQQMDDLDRRLPDFEVIKAAGINILGDVDVARGPRTPSPVSPERLETMAASFEAARRHSDKNFLIMPGEEMSDVVLGLGGHNDLLFSKPVYWTHGRATGQPLVEDHPTYGKVYHVGGAADLMEMTTRENMLVFMAHPRTKGSQGFPDAIRNTAHFRHENFAGAGWRWGMGLDLSEERLADARVMTLFDDMNNWVADLPTPKYLIAITETQSTDRGEPVHRFHKVAGDDTYGMNPVSYVKVDPLPTPDDMTPLINALKRGDVFATTGEVLIPTYAVLGTGSQRTIAAEVEWTFPLEFVEVVWGDGHKTDRQIISATDLPPFGRRKFAIPFNASGKKWVRFAVWDSAGNGAFVQPIRLQAATATTGPTESDVILFAKNEMIPMRDGVTLATDIYRPAVGGVPVAERLPILLQRTPYDKENANLVRQARYFASHGYVVALQDERGAHHSEGVQSKYTGYGQDGYDTIEWLAKRPYTDGQVAMWGTSYAAHAQAGAAIQNPPHLRTAILNCGGLYNAWLYKVRNHGAFELVQQTTWAFGQLPKPEKAAPWIGKIAASRGRSPLASRPSFEDYYFEIMTRADYDEYWKQPDRNWSLHYEQTADIPMLHLTGWYDSYTSGSILNFQNLSRIKNSPIKLIVGPWVHGGNTRSNAGDVEFGRASAIEDFADAFHLRWFDRFLKGRDTGVDREPAVKLFVMGTGDGHKDEHGRLFHGGYWRSSSAWPLPETIDTSYYLHAGGSLSTTPPTGGAPTKYVYDPAHPVPTIGGSFSGTADLSPAGAFDQREASPVFGSAQPYRSLRERPDVGVFQTAPLERDVEVIGPIVVKLYAASNAPDTDFTAKLVDVYPPTSDYPLGFEMNVTDGIVRARYRNSPERPEMLKAGEVYEFTIEPFPTANVFKRGHRIRIDVSSSNFPRFDVNPNTGEPLGRNRRTQIAENMLYHDAAHPSAVVLPIVPHASPQPAGAAGAQPQYSDRFVTVNGLRLHYLDWGTTDKPPLIMLHGIARHAHTFDHLAAELARDHHVIAVDMRGHGDSAWSPEGAYLVEDYVKDIEGLVAQLQLRRLTLLGNSTGGRVVQVFAGLHPELVERAIVEDVGPERPQEIASGFARRVKEEADGWASEDELVAQLAKQNPRTPESLLRTYAHYGVTRRGDGRLVWKRDPNLVKGFVATELWQYVRRITAPIVYVLGGASTIVPADAQERLKQALPNSEIVTMPGLGHYPSSEDAAGFMRIANRFLKRSQ